MDPLSAPADDLHLVATALTALLAPYSAGGMEAWGRSVATALGALAGARDTVLVLQYGRAVRAFGSGISEEMFRHALRSPSAPAVPDDAPPPLRTRAWCRLASALPCVAAGPHPSPVHTADDAVDGHRYDAVGLTTELGLPGSYASAACHFAAARDAVETHRRLELLRAVLPAFAAAARTHLFAGTSRTAAASLLNAAGAASLLCGADGRVYHTTPALDRALEADPDATQVRDAMLAAARAFAQRQRHWRGTSGARARLSGEHPLIDDPFGAQTPTEVATRGGRYVVRCCEVSAESLATIAAIAVTIEKVAAPTDPLANAVAAAGARFGLTARERDVTRLLLTGKSNADVASTLGISGYTARHHTERVLGKLRLRSRAEVPGLLHGHVGGGDGDGGDGEDAAASRQS